MKTIVFVRKNANPRMYNQVYALKQSKNYKLILLCRTFDEIMLGKFREVFDEIICYQPLDLQKHGLRQDVSSSFPMHLMKYVINHYIDPHIGRMSERIRLPYILRQLEPDVCVCQGTEYKIITQVMKNTKCPIILDVHDGSPTKGIENLSESIREKEKYIFEHASGIIHRGPPEIEINYYKEHGYKITCPVLQHIDCCNKAFFVNKNTRKLSSEDGELHLVGMGGGYSSLLYTQLIKKLTKQKIHYHLYCVPHSIISPIVFKEYKKLNKNEKYFHLEKAVPFDKVQEEIAKYDFGTHLAPHEYLRNYSYIYKKVSFGNRPLTYLESGLPTIISEGIGLQKEFAEENGIGFGVKDNEIDNIYEMIKKYDYDKAKENVLKTREKFLIDNYVERLVKFYDEVIQRG